MEKNMLSKQSKPEITFGESLPYLEMKDDGVLWLKDGSASISFRLIPKNSLSFTEGDFEALRSGLTPLIDQIPQGAMLQVWLSRRRSCEQNDHAYQNWLALREQSSNVIAIPTAQRSLQEARERLLTRDWENGSIFQTEIFITIRVPAEQRVKPQTSMGPLSHFKSKILRKSETRKSFEMIESELSSLKAQLQIQLETIGFDVHELSVKEKWQILYGFFNPERKRIPELENVGHSLNLSDSLSSTDLMETKRGIQLGRTRIRIGSLKTYPESSQPAMLSGLTNESSEFDLIYTILALDGVKERERLSRKQRLATGMASGNNVRDITAEAQLRDIEATLQAMGGGEKLCAASLHLICREEALETGDRSYSFEQLLSHAEGLGMGCQWFEETVAAFPVFFGTLPFAPTHLTRPKRLLSSNLSDMLPVYGIGAGHKEATILFETPYQSNMGFSLYEKSPSANAILIGSTGSGKSTLACGLILGMNAGSPKEAPSSFVIDVGNSFKRTVTYLGGASLDLSPEQGTCINPFDLEPGQRHPTPEKTKFLTALFDEILGDAGNLSKLERALLETELLNFYQKEEVRTLSRFKTYLEKSAAPELKNFSKLLSLWCRPHPYGLLLDGETNVQLNAPHLHFELKGCQRYPDLLRVAMLVVMNLIWTEVKNRFPRRSLVVIDEAHTVIRSSGDGRTNLSARWVEDLFRQMRKFASSAIAISQTAKDLKNDEIGDGILANAPNRFILKQRGDEATLKNDLKLNDKELSDVFGLTQVRGSFSEFYLHAESIRGVFRYCPTPHELWLSTTHPPDQALFTETSSSHPDWDLPQLIDFLAEQYPEGAERGMVPA
jgi:type IV secretory pathway VirB4 component